MKRVFAIALCAAAAPAHAERLCLQGPMDPTHLASGRNVIAGSGGVIVATGEKFPDWRFRSGNKVVRPHVVTVAPGLAIYHPPPTPGVEVILENLEHDVLAVKKRAFSIEPPPGPPVLESITSTTAQKRTTVVAKLAANPPETALVAIVSRVEGDKLVPLTWAMVRSKQALAYTLWHTPYTCEQTVTASIQPKVGERVVVTWLDDAGRLSEPSTPIVIAGAALKK
jgi:hypothetical protein